MDISDDKSTGLPKVSWITDDGLDLVRFPIDSVLKLSFDSNAFYIYGSLMPSSSRKPHALPSSSEWIPEGISHDTPKHLMQ